MLAIVGPVLSIVVSITREDVRKAISHDSSAAGFALLRQHGGLRSHRVYQKKKIPREKMWGRIGWLTHVLTCIRRLIVRLVQQETD